MKNPETITLAQIRLLKEARGMAADWIGNTDPKDHDEFNAFIQEITNAIKAVERDRKLLRRLLKRDNDGKTNK